MVVLSGNFSIICKKINTNISQLQASHLCIWKRIGPKTLLWGIPLKTVAGYDFILLTLTIWQRLLKKAFHHSKTLPLILYDLSLPSSLSWGALSNALAKSKYIVSTSPPDTWYQCTYQDKIIIVSLWIFHLWNDTVSMTKDFWLSCGSLSNL